ncbi:hypothetical protein V6N13_019837 [Hibiscus sabdariffa]
MMMHICYAKINHDIVVVVKPYACYMLVKHHISLVRRIISVDKWFMPLVASWSSVRRHALESRAQLCTERTWVLGFGPFISDNRNDDCYGQLVTVGGIMTCTSVLQIYWRR